MIRIIKNLNYFFVILLTSQKLFAQDKELSGLIISKSSYLSGANIKDKRSGFWAISGTRGYFRIKANLGDTLLVTMIGFISDTTVVKSQNDLIIQLIANSINFREVEVKDNKLSPLRTLNQSKVDYHEAYKRGDNSNMFLTSPVGIGVNIDALYSTFSQQGKNGRNLQHEINEQYLQEIIDKKFNKHLIESVTGFHGEKLDLFMQKYRPTYDFIHNKNEVDVIVYIKRCMATEKI
jgi:hypothetical protein